jgi:hypothetical protein
MARKDTAVKTPTVKTPEPKSSSMPLFYKNPQPLSSDKHKDLGLKKNFGLGFTRTVNAVPINMIEMAQICHFYPIAFSPDASAMPVAILGLRDNENLFLRENGTWESDIYIPSYIRRYPFIFSESPGKKDQLTLCVDMNDEVTEKNSGQNFFEKDGKPSALSNNAIEFCKSYQAAAKQTAEFGAMLDKSGLLVNREAQIVATGKRKINFSGFRIVDEKKLGEMKDKDFLEWRRKGWLPFLYAHLFSGSQWHRLTRLLNERLKNEAA